MRPSNRECGSAAAIRKLVADRAGREWCLFLDRDGVINRQVVGDYVRSLHDFEWLPRASRALKLLRGWAPYLVVVTNQQGVGKGLMSSAEVESIHRHIETELEMAGVRIDSFQVCPHLQSADCACRKPRLGLISDWLGRHPGSEPSLSVMVGDSPSDLELATNVATEFGGCASIQIGNKGSPKITADAAFSSLWEFAIAVGRARREIV